MSSTQKKDERKRDITQKQPPKKSPEKNMSEIDEHILKRFDVKKRLGKGAYGIVWKAVDKKTKDIVAIKKIFDAFRNQTDAQRTFREIIFLQSFRNHPNIVKLHSIHRALNNRDIYLGFEYMETDLHNVIKRGNILKDIHKRYIMYQMLKATKYIHSGNVIHRDQKPSNVLIDSACRVKLADFGLARSVSSMYSGGEDGADPCLTDYVATRWYRAPEILIASKNYTKGIDMWSLGCILGEMLTGKPLFPGTSTVNQVERIMAALPRPSPDETPKGTVVGQNINNAFNVFYGIPYGSVDEKNRFGDAEQYPNFSTPFIASNSSIICPQVQRVQGGIIQCLTLNILVPNVENTDPLPVYVWFFGGGFVMGNASEYDGRPLAKHGIIVVTVNYRLGPYGFLCTDKTRNQGLKDQAVALKWVKFNIAAFGGDPDKVTIGGQSYGGGAVDFHLYSQDKLFSKAIIQSGSKFANGIMSKKDNSGPLKLAHHLGSNAGNLNQAMKFLNKADPMEVMTAAKDLKLRFGVCKENYDNVDKVKDIPILIGYNSKEDFAGFAMRDDEFYKTLGDPFYNSLSQTFTLDNNTLKNLAETVKSFYLGSKNVSKDSMLELVDFASDFKLNYAVERSVTNYLRLNNTKVFKYIFSYVGISPYKDIEGVGAYHTEELQFLFKRGSDKFNSEQLVLMDRMTMMWTNFIKYGNPNLLQADLLRDKWLPMNLEQRPYYNLDFYIYLEKHVNHHRMAFWELLWNSYGRKALNIAEVCSGYGSSLIREQAVNPSNANATLTCLLSCAPRDASDLVQRLLVFNPAKRLSAERALDHEYVGKFHRERDEPTLPSDVLLPLRDDKQMSVDDYRNKLYSIMTKGSHSFTGQQRKSYSGSKSHTLPPPASKSKSFHDESKPYKSKMNPISSAEKTRPKIDRLIKEHRSDQNVTKPLKATKLFEHKHEWVESKSHGDYFQPVTRQSPSEFGVLSGGKKTVQQRRNSTSFSTVTIGGDADYLGIGRQRHGVITASALMDLRTSIR